MNSDLLSPESMEAIADVMRKRLVRGQSVSIPGVGTLSVVHAPSEVIPGDEVASLTPPRDSIAFEYDQQRIPA